MPNLVSVAQWKTILSSLSEPPGSTLFSDGDPSLIILVPDLPYKFALVEC